MNHKGTFSSLLFCVFLISGCGTSEPPKDEIARLVRAMKVGDVAAIAGRSFPGRAKAVQEVDLSFRVTGPLITLSVKVGDKVIQGDLVARIDPRDYEVQLRNAQGQLDRSNANRTRAQSDYDRAINIQRQDPGAIGEASVDKAKENLDVANADLAALEATVDAAKDALGDTYLKAPFDGTVVATYVENFETVQAKQPILRILDNARIEFVFNVPETMISLISKVRDITVIFDAFPEVVVPAEIREVGTEASETTRTYPITLIMDQPEGVEILPGMAGKVTGKARPPEAADGKEIIVPVTAVFSPREQKKSYVWVIDPKTGSVSRREVDVGRLVTGGIMVESGLQSGELIATAGVHYLKEGQTVRPAVD